MMEKMRGSGGLKAYLGTADAREIEKMIEAGSEKAKKQKGKQIWYKIIPIARASVE